MRWRPALGLWLVALGGAPGPATAATTPQQVPDPADEVVLGKRSSIRLPEASGETVLVTTGTRLHALPDRRSTLLDIVGADAPLPVLERASGWVMVRVLGQAGWAAVADGRTGPDVEASPDLEFLTARAEPLAPHPERLARAGALLGEVGATSVGPFTIYTDLDDPAAVELVTGLVSQVPAAYEARYGLELWAPDRFAVVIFATEATYREFELHDRELADLRASGHAAGNIAAIYAGDRRRPELEAILLHELTHLLNRSAFRGNLPAWLEEGMAEDLSLSRIDRAGRLDPDRLGGVDRRYLEFTPNGARSYVTELWGAPVTLSRLVEALRADQLPPLLDLLSLSRRQMVALEDRPLRYGQAAFLIRYLLEGAGASGRAGLREFLRRAAAGEGAEPDDLVAHLGRDWDALTRDYERWLVVRERRLQVGG